LRETWRVTRGVQPRRAAGGRVCAGGTAVTACVCEPARNAGQRNATARAARRAPLRLQDTQRRGTPGMAMRLRTVDDVFGAAQAHHGDLQALRRLAGEQRRGRAHDRAVLLLARVAPAAQKAPPGSAAGRRGRGASRAQLARRGGPRRVAPRAAAAKRHAGGAERGERRASADVSARRRAGRARRSSALLLACCRGPCCADELRAVPCRDAGVTDLTASPCSLQPTSDEPRLPRWPRLAPL